MSPRRLLVTALFDDPDAVERAVALLGAAGLPRDLVEVVVTPEAAEAHYPGRARGPGRETLRYAGVGGLAGLGAGATLSLVLLALPGRTELEGAIAVQLLGPNVATIAGALVGAAAGSFVRRRPDPRVASPRPEAEGRILVVAGARNREEAEALQALLVRGEGSAVRVED